MDENVKKMLEEILAKNDGALTAKAQEEMLKTFGASLTDELIKKFEDKFGKLEQEFTNKDLNKKKGAFNNFADFVMSVKNYSQEENINKLKTLETGVQGEYIIPTEYAAGLLDFNQGSNDFMQYLTKFPLNGNSYSHPSYSNKNRTSANFFGGIVSYWVEEGTAPTASDMKFGKINFRLHDLAMLIPVTNDMIEDSPIAVSNMVNYGFQSRLKYDMENMLFNGSGAGQPLGIFKSGALVTQTKKTSQTAATIVSENLIGMKNLLPAGSKTNAVWVYAPTVATEVQNCKIGASDFPAFIPAGAMSANQTLDTILGRPAFESEHLSAALGTVNDILLFDPTQYGIAYKALQRQVESSAHLYFDSNKTAFRMVFRVDGQPLWDTYITPANGSIYKSPFVVLETRG